MASCETIRYNDLSGVNGIAPTDTILIVNSAGEPRRMTVADFLANLTTIDTNLANENLTLLENRIHQLENFILSFMGEGKIGIGTETPTSKLTVKDGDIEIADRDKGLIQTDEGDQRRRISFNADGIMCIDEI